MTQEEIIVKMKKLRHDEIERRKRALELSKERAMKLFYRQMWKLFEGFGYDPTTDIKITEQFFHEYADFVDSGTVFFELFGLKFIANYHASGISGRPDWAFYVYLDDGSRYGIGSWWDIAMQLEV